MKYPRLIQEIHQIEVTTRCNLRCRYCPHPKMQRPKEDMEFKTFLRAMHWVEYFYQRGLQSELSFTGIGESTMHPQFKEMLLFARDRCPNMPILFSTNGLPTFDEDLAKLCSKIGIQVMVSLHRPEMAGKCIELCKKYGILRYVNSAFATSAFNWAGQVEGWFNSAPSTPCAYLARGWGVVLQDGQITTCCLDSENYGVVGTVWDEPGSLSIAPYKLCENCHEQVP